MRFLTILEAGALLLARPRVLLPVGGSHQTVVLKCRCLLTTYPLASLGRLLAKYYGAECVRTSTSLMAIERHAPARPAGAVPSPVRMLLLAVRLAGTHRNAKFDVRHNIYLVKPE